MVNSAISTADSYRETVNGWHYVRLQGDPGQVGEQHGRLLAKEIGDALVVADFMARQDTGDDLAYFADKAGEIFGSKILPEYAEELDGIVAGAKSQNVKVTRNELIAWNAYSELVGTWWASQQHPDIRASVRTKGGLHRCSAFVCTGSVTTHGQIVMAHNSWDRYACGDTYNVILDITPSHGNRMVMQGAAGYITSNMDWVMTGGGLMINETTIGSAVGFSEDGEPEFQRSRAAAQYSSSITQWRERICKDNNGGYANSWLLGDVNTKEIARLDLGFKNQGFVSKKDGYYTGFNVAEDLRVRNQDCTDPGQYSNILGNGSRRLRWDQLFAQNHGKVDLTLAEAMIADHYDVYRRIDNTPGSRTICGHLELDDGSLGNHGQGPFYPWGANDGKVTDSDVVSKELGFQARWGNSCGREFNVAAFTKEHPQYAWLDGHMKNRPPQPWTHFPLVGER